MFKLVTSYRSLLTTTLLVVAMLSLLSGFIANQVAYSAMLQTTPTIIYVDANVSGGANDGSNWANAYRYLQDALAQANANSTQRFDIWVARGVYYPDMGADMTDNDATQSFTLRHDNVQLYGGFAPQGGAATWESRNWQAHPTVLSGDIEQDDTTNANGVIVNATNISGTNALHVLWLDGVNDANISAETVIDGFTITGGYATGDEPADSGGGLYCDGKNSGNACNPTLRNLAFTGNRAEYGGAICNDGESGGESSPTLTNVTFTNNWADGDGGAIYNYGYQGISSPTLTDVIFTGNRADDNGGAIFNNGYQGISSPILANVTFSGNWTEEYYGGAIYNNGEDGVSSPILTNVSFINNWAEYGGAIYNDGEDGGVSSPTLTNVTFTNNRAAEDGGAIYNYGYQGISSPTLTHVSFTSNWADDDGGAIYNDGEDGVSSPTLTNVTFTRNRAEYYGGAIYNDGQDGVSSPTLTDVTFNNNRAEYGGAIYNDGQSAGESSPILIDVTFSSNWAEYDGGAIYNYGYQGFSNPTLTDVTFSNNWAGSDGGAIYNDGEEGVSSPTLTNVIFIGSQAEDDGGAIYNDGEDGVSSPILTNVSFTGNWAGIDGGAIYNYGYQGVSSPTLTNVSFTGNWAGSDGGAIYNDGEDGVSSPNLTNVSFINNRAEDDGGAIYFDGDNGDVSATIINGLFVANGTDHIAYDDGNENTQPQFVNCTFVGATAQAINITYWDSGETPIDFVNSIFWGNNRLVDFTDDDPEVAPATMVNINYSIVEEASYASANNNLFADPLFLSAATGNYRLLASSPAVDSGDNSAVVGVTTDLDGNARTIGATVDRGAYEYGASNLAISKLVSPNSAVPYQGLITYTITLSNSGTIADASVVFTDTLPAGVEFVQWITQADANEQGGTLTWSGAIQPATARTWSFQARHTGNYGDVITNTAHFSGSDRTGAASATFSVVAALPGYVSIPTPDSTISLGSIQVGDSLTSTLTISNTGSGMLTISNSQISGAGAAAFSLVSPPVFPLSIASGGPSEMLQIVCNPTAAGVLTATLTLNTNDTTQSSVSYPLTCTGLAAPEPEPEDPSTRIFLPVVMKGN